MSETLEEQMNTEAVIFEQNDTLKKRYLGSKPPHRLYKANACAEIRKARYYFDWL